MSTICRKPAAGFAIISAIFILVVLAALAGFIVSVTATQNLTFAQDIQGARANQAARAGIEWGISRWVNNYTCSSSSSPHITFSDANLQGFTATVTATTRTNTGSMTTTATGSSGSNQITVPSPIGIGIGRTVSGTGIAGGATVSSLSGTTVTLSASNTATVSGSVSFGMLSGGVTTATGSSGAATITVADTSGMATGMKVTGVGIASGATISSITGSVLTLSANNTTAVSGNITFGIVFCELISTAQPTTVSAAGNLGFVERSVSVLVEN